MRRQIWATIIQKPIDFMSRKLNATEPWRTLRKQLWFMAVFGSSEYIRRIFPTSRLGGFLFGRKHSQDSQVNHNSCTSQEKGKQKLDLLPGDWVQVKPFEEILATLNSKGKLRGLAFTKEMIKYCGQRFRVRKKLQRIVLESTGEIRTIATPTVILEGVVCNGEYHGNCDRTCFCFWREDWLCRVSSPQDKDK